MPTIKGSCACGELRYEVDAAPPYKKALCHCKNCQKLTGTSYSENILIPRTNYKMTAGEAKHYTFIQEPSGLSFTTTFCGNCGGRLCKQSEDPAFKDVIILQARTVDGDAFDGTPNVELWTPQRQNWVEPVQGAAQAQGFS